MELCYPYFEINVESKLEQYFLIQRSVRLRSIFLPQPGELGVLVLFTDLF